ncbi:MAG: NAD(+) diphosphatase [Steroidobacteraceae bacterium]
MRSHSLWAQEARADPHTRYLICQGTAHLVRGEPDSSIALLSAAQAHIDTIDDSRLLLLGWYEGERCVLVDLPADAAFACPGATFEELRPLLPVLSEAQAQLLSVARALVIWRARQRHCGVCAAPTEPRNAGHMLACTGCGAEFFPRIDPAIIVLVTDGTKALLGRQASWPAGRYSALAGFVEPGESLEQAVAREVEEESGVQITEARYFASQPWPFPASLMLGFHARASAGPVRLDGELEDARWFELGQLRSDSTVLLPPAHTIARRLIEAWFAQHGERAPGG